MTEDKLEEIFRMQRELADIIDSNRYPRGIEYRISVLMTALTHEAVELQRLTPWKWWQIPKPMNEGHAREEAIDILHFLIQTLIELGMTPDDVLKEYKKKHKVNVDRQNNGY